MVLGKLLVPGRPANLDYSRARANCACCKCGWGLCRHFSFVYHFSLLSSSLGGGPIKTEILSQRAVKPKTPNPTQSSMSHVISVCIWSSAIWFIE